MRDGRSSWKPYLPDIGTKQKGLTHSQMHAVKIRYTRPHKSESLEFIVSRDCYQQRKGREKATWERDVLVYHPGALTRSKQEQRRVNINGSSFVTLPEKQQRLLPSLLNEHGVSRRNPKVLLKTLLSHFPNQRIDDVMMEVNPLIRNQHQGGRSSQCKCNPSFQMRIRYSWRLLAGLSLLQIQRRINNYY